MTGVATRPAADRARTYFLRAKAPLRVSFAGGGTDVPPFPEQEGGLVLSATINRHAYGTLCPRPDRQVLIESLDLGLAVEYGVGRPIAYDGNLDFIKAPILKLGDGRAPGFELFLHSTTPPGSGLGSSSAMMVTMIGLLRDFHGLPLTDYEVASLAHQVERVDLGLQGGLQDQYASTFGGFNFIEFYGDHVIVNPLRVPASTVNELEHNLLLCFTGATRKSDRIIEDQVGRFSGGNADSREGLRMQKELAAEMKKALLLGRLQALGELLDEAWRQKKRLSPKISTPFIDEAYEEAMRQGAYGGKVMGAGGGGYMLFYCDFRRKHRVAQALERLGMSVSDVAFEFEGLGTWRVDGNG